LPHFDHREGKAWWWQVLHHPFMIVHTAFIVQPYRVPGADGPSFDKL
jgi:hypothetical protein